MIDSSLAKFTQIRNFSQSNPSWLSLLPFFFFFFFLRGVFNLILHFFTLFYFHCGSHPFCTVGTRKMRFTRPPPFFTFITIYSKNCTNNDETRVIYQTFASFFFTKWDGFLFSHVYFKYYLFLLYGVIIRVVKMVLTNLIIESRSMFVLFST